MEKEYKIRHLSVRQISVNNIYINLIFEPLEDTFKEWCESEASKYKLEYIIKEKSLKDYLEKLDKISHKELRELDQYIVRGYNWQNNILIRLKAPFNNIYRYCEFFENNSVVKACIERLSNISLYDQCELISILKTLEYWWY